MGHMDLPGRAGGVFGRIAGMGHLWDIWDMRLCLKCIKGKPTSGHQRGRGIGWSMPKWLINGSDGPSRLETGHKLNPQDISSQ